MHRSCSGKLTGDGLLCGIAMVFHDMAFVNVGYRFGSVLLRAINRIVYGIAEPIWEIADASILVLLGLIRN